jgi:hypothetical protein
MRARAERDCPCSLFPSRSVLHPMNAALFGVYGIAGRVNLQVFSICI